jgi:hypothetical protein
VTEPLIDVHSGELFAQAHGGDGVITLKLTGTADAVSRPALNNLLGRLHNECNRAEARKVVVDLHDLEFMNSSCFKSFITWIVALRRLPEDQRYHILFRANPELDWQERSLHPIEYFGGGLVSIEQG